MGRTGLLVGMLALVTGCVDPARSPRMSPATGPAPKPVAQALERSDADAALELAVHDLVNAHRRSVGLPRLTLDQRINRLSRLHSAAMAAGRVQVGHDGFAERAKLVAQGTSKGVAENVAYDVGHADPATAIVQGWLKSRTHRENLEGPYDRTGVGVARNLQGEIYVTQMFVGS